MIKKLFFITLLFFLSGELIRFDFGNSFIIKPLDIGIGITVLLWLITKLINKQKFRHSNLLIPIIAFSLLGFFSLTINRLDLSINEFLISISYLVRWVFYAGIFFVVCDFNKQFKQIVSNMLVIVGSMIVAFGYIQYFFYSDLHNISYLGWDEHMVRMVSVFLDPNFAGAFFVLLFLFLINLFLKKKNILMGLFSVLTMGAIFLTFSRSALIMLIVSSTILFIQLNKKKWIGLLLTITLLALLLSSRFFDIENINLFRIVSSEARINTAVRSIEIIKDHPIFGVGFNAYRYAKLDKVSRNDSSKLISHADAGTDNSFLLVLATTGIVGLIIYSFMWVKLVKMSSSLGIASVIGIFINSMFINSLFYPFIMFWLWIILALSIKNHN